MPAIIDGLEISKLSQRKIDQYTIMSIVYAELAGKCARNGSYEVDVINLHKELTGKDLRSATEYVRNSLISINKNYGVMVNAFIPYLVNWRWERIPLIIQAILLMTYAHFYFVEENINKAIVIDNAVKMAKLYHGDTKTINFVNAILDKVLVYK